MRFEERELKPYAEPANPALLREGETYFSVQFADDELLIPIMQTWVFAGRNLDSGDTKDHLYFQDVESYRKGIRYDSATPQNAAFQVASEENIKHVFDYEHALDQLLMCSLRRRNLSNQDC